MFMFSASSSKNDRSYPFRQTTRPRLALFLRQIRQDRDGMRGSPAKRRISLFSPRR
jgi:hypothetical protein